MCLRQGTEREPAVVGHVEPLVPVAGPRVRELHPVHQMPGGRVRGRPQPERTVHMHPGAVAVRDIAACPQIVAGAGVDVTCLQAHHRRTSRAVAQRRFQRGHPHRRCAREPVPLHVPARPGEQVVAGRRQTSRVARLAAGDEPGRR